MKSEVLKFLERVWTVQPDGHIAVAWKPSWESDLWRQRMREYEEFEAVAYQNRGRDLYFCPNTFSEPRRVNQCALPSRWLYADLDEIDPSELDIEPTVWWETSRDRFQCMWLLDEAIDPSTHARINQKLTYFCAADKNGWPLAKVLRTPGSKSTKHGYTWKIEAHWTGVVYNASEIWQKVKYEPTPAQADRIEKYRLDPKKLRLGNRLISGLDKPDAAKFRQRMARDRSTWVWQLACLCRDNHMKPKHAVIAVAASPVAQDKYAGRVIQEVARVVQKVYREKKPKKRSVREVAESNGHVELQLVDADRFLAQHLRPPAWAIERIWSEEAHGFFAGPAKAYKSTIVLDLAVSFATGTPFLNKFPIGVDSGHVIMIQEENRAGTVQHRIKQIQASRGLLRAGELPRRLNMSLMNNKGFRLTEQDHLDWLIDRIQEKQAKLVVIDPWYLTAEGDENSAEAAQPILQNLLRVKNELKCGILLVHHTRKPQRDGSTDGSDPNEMAGTGALFRWCESFVQVEPMGDRSEHTVSMFTVHRNEPPDDPIHIKFDIGGSESMRYRVEVEDTRESARSDFDIIRDLVAESPGITIAVLAEEMGWRTERMTRKIERSDEFQLERRRGSSPSVYLVD